MCSGGVKTRLNPWKRGTLRVPQMLVNNIDLARKKCPSSLRCEAWEIRIFKQQGLELEPGRAWLDVGEVALCELHASHWRLRIIHWLILNYCLTSKGFSKPLQRYEKTARLPNKKRKIFSISSFNFMQVHIRIIVMFKCLHISRKIATFVLVNKKQGKSSKGPARWNKFWGCKENKQTIYKQI